MSTQISPAIIMRTWEFGETDLLVTFFTPHQGQVKGIAKGARRSRERFVNALDVLSLVSLEYGPGKKDGLLFLVSGKLLDSFPGIRADFGRLSRASYMIELAEILFPQGVPEREVFDLLKASLASLSGDADPAGVLLAYEARIMALGGYGIRLEKCCVCGREYAGEGTAVFERQSGGIACLKCRQKTLLSPSLGPESVGILGLLQSGGFPGAGDRRLPEEVLKEIGSVLRLHRDYRLGKRLKTSKYVE